MEAKVELLDNGPDGLPRTSFEPRSADIDYPALTLFVVLTLTTCIGVPVFGFLYGYQVIDWVMLIALYVLSGLGITVGYHRLLSHRSFECRSWVKACLLVLGGWALQNSALRWCADHVRHHGNCDQEEDPYNAMKGLWYSHCGWVLLKSVHRHPRYEVRLSKDDLVRWQHQYYVPIALSGLALPFALGLALNGWMGGLSCFLLAGVGRAFLVLNSTFCINSLCHNVGSQPYGKQDSSRDSWWLSFVTLGEGYHNYHHNHQRDYRNGPEWYHLDPSKWLIFGLSKLGLAYNLHRSRL